MKRFLLFFIVLISIPSRLSGTVILAIRSQSDLDTACQNVEKAAKSGEKDIRIQFFPGDYYFQHKTFFLPNKDWSGISLSMLGGKDVRIFPAGKSYSDGDFFSGEFIRGLCWISDGKVIDIETEWMQAAGLVEVVNKSQKLCRIKKAEEDRYRADSSSEITFTQWYWTKTYKVQKDDGKYIYFTADDLEYLTKYLAYNCNYDFIIGKSNPRYSLFNAIGCPVRKEAGKIKLNGYKTIFCGESSIFFFSTYSSIGKILIDGLSFIGNGPKNGLLLFGSTKSSEITVSNCSFDSIHKMVIDCSGSDNLDFRNNRVEGLYDFGIYTSNECRNTKIRGNIFTDCCRSLDFGKAKCIKVSGTSFSVSDNVFRDCTICSIHAGRGQKDTKPCEGVIEHNEIYYTSKVLANPLKYCSIDNGAIYTSTFNDNVAIRYNYIHDISGVAQNRGIFCDDGTMGVKVYANIVTGIANSYCIDLRRVEMNGVTTNTNNTIRYNIIDGSFRFEGRSSDDGNVRGENFLIIPDGEKKEIKTNKWTEGEDILLPGGKVKDGGVEVPTSFKRKLKKAGLLPHMAKFVTLRRK